MPRVPRQSVKIVELLEQVCRAAQDSDGPKLLATSQWAVLRYFSTARRDARTVTGLARHLGGTKGPASRSIAALQRRGLLRGARDNVDKRLIIFELTSEGKELMAHDPQRRFALTISALPAADQRRFAKLLKSVSDAFEMGHQG